MEIEVPSSSETSVSFYHTVRRYVLENGSFGGTLPISGVA
jgi:hypothetical protein